MATSPGRRSSSWDARTGHRFFCYGTAHATGANRTDRERAGVAFHFLRADYAQDELIQPDRDYRPYLTGPQATGGLREYGEQVAGTWEREVAEALAFKLEAGRRG